VTGGSPLVAELDIRKGFEVFVEAARCLEESYQGLQARAAAIDLQLAETNKELEKTLLEREMIFRSLPVGVLATNDKGEMTWCNQEGHRLVDMAAAAGLPLVRQAEGQLEIGAANLRLRRVKLPDGGELVLVEDRSQVVHLRREVDRLDRLAGLSELALGIAHEIKNPLNGVMGFAALMSKTTDSDKLQRFAGKVNEGLEQVDSIVKALLAFARPVDKARQRAPLSQIVGEAASAAGVPASRVELSGSEHEWAESMALIRVLAILFRNSVEAASSGDTGVRIQVRADTDGDRLTLAVSDNGPGIDRDLAARIFQPFVSSKDRGHGLGLALACRVLSFLNGSIELLNPGEAGAVFRLTVPNQGRRPDRQAEEVQVGP
jgi:signal transduction histidine kinase